MSSTEEKRGCLLALFPKKHHAPEETQRSYQSGEITRNHPSTPTTSAQLPEYRSVKTKQTARQKTKPDPTAYRTAKSLLTPAELKFYSALRQITDPRATLICPKVRMADILDIVDTDNYMSHFGRIKSRHVDFVICHVNTLKPIAAIELDDNSHKSPKRRKRDKFVNTAFRAAGLPLIHIWVQYDYDIEELKQIISEKFKQALHAPISKNEQIETLEPPTCPSCHIPMVERIASRGPQAGQPFWGCENYPNCREIKPMS